ncbi:MULTISPECIES: hypothetical protein [unclassified Rhizobium]|uniref:hypothetical protein n=1 Tax=unclassified Rhizobium TaxID=2613769 RepID=UPI000B12A1DC|nr:MULTISPECIES: hypothetical protein [unclassified Rhizobium]
MLAESLKQLEKAWDQNPGNHLRGTPIPAAKPARLSSAATSRIQSLSNSAAGDNARWSFRVTRILF